MPTKAELEAELATLKADLEQARERRAHPARASAEAAANGLSEMLKQAGIDAGTLEALGPGLLDELASLQQDRPLTVLIGAFALGFAAGRATA